MTDWTWADWTLLAIVGGLIAYVTHRARAIGDHAKTIRDRNLARARAARQWLENHSRGEEGREP